MARLPKTISLLQKTLLPQLKEAAYNCGVKFKKFNEFENKYSLTETTFLRAMGDYETYRIERTPDEFWWHLVNMGFIQDLYEIIMLCPKETSPSLEVLALKKIRSEILKEYRDKTLCRTELQGRLYERGQFIADRQKIRESFQD